MNNKVTKSASWLGGMAAEVGYTIVCMLVGMAICLIAATASK